jgi:tetratricopeptide (TPR) repeat protein
MPTSRLNQLEQFYKDEPQDPFNLYALALEYLKLDLHKSRECFDRLLTEHSQYLPTYYHAAKLYQDLNDREQAIAIYEKGIALAKKINDAKAIRELQSAYQELLFE